MKHVLRARLILLAAVMLSPSIVEAGGAMPDFKMTGHASAVTSVCFSPDSKRLCSVDDNGQLKLWDIATQKQLISFDGVFGTVRQAKFTPDGKAVVALSATGVIVIDVATGKASPIAVPNMQSGPTAFDLSPDGNLIAVVGRGALKIIELSSGTAKAEWEVHKDYSIDAVAFSPDGKHVATASTDHTSLVIDRATGSIPATLNLVLNGTAVLFSNDGKRVFTWATDSSLRSFDAATGEGETVIEIGTVKTMSLSADGKSIFVGGLSRAPLVVSIANKKLADGVYDSENLVYSAAASPDGKWVAGGANEGSVYLWKSR